MAARRGEPLVVADAERARRRVLGWPPFGGVAELSGDAVAVGAACDALRGASAVTVLGPVDDGKRALVRAATVDDLCDALASPASRPRTRSVACGSTSIPAGRERSGRALSWGRAVGSERRSGSLDACPVTCCGSSAIPC